ncbi:MAG: TlyA family RNA methyltransferase [Candidatus Dependentiae bacterium]|nr:TlyA family RNA methyltransferase [Candidatus Dependentiae bacterium]
MKQRLDAVLAARHPQYSRTQLQSFILQGKVLVNGRPEVKAGASVSEDDEVLLTAEQPRYVCRGGRKLEAALAAFGVDVHGLTVLDAGISTGGFTDCLLQHGAEKVYGIDVGYGQVHEKIRTDPRVLVIERTNLRHYVHNGDPIDLVTLDLSFISLSKVMDAVSAFLKPGGALIALIKPQFEAEKGQVPKGGVIVDPVQRTAIVTRVVGEIESAGFLSRGLIESPITGGEGNVEYLAYFSKKDG